MEHYSDQGCGGIELLDLLFDQNEGILRHEEMGCQNNRPWPVPESNTLIPAQDGNDFLNVLLNASDSVSGSPVWSPSPSDSGISDDPHSDQMDSPHPPESPPLEPRYTHAQPPLMAALDMTETDLPMDLNGWESGFFPGKPGEMHCASEVHNTHLSSGFPLTVKDLLLSGTPEPASKQSFQELILNEDERKLLAKEGATLPSQLPLTKYEERILKKIRRKIRNKQSAQESRKKKKEYIDGLESRMAACSAQNQELQRKVFQLEKCNMSLMEQLRRLQALVMNRANIPAQTGTCILVFLLSFSLILFPSLKPFSESKVSQDGDFSSVRVQSRSLHNLQSTRVLHILDQPYSAPEEPKTLPGFSEEKGMKEITSLLGKLHTGQGLPNYDHISHNNSLDEQHHRGDPITGHITTVTLSPRDRATLRPHADDM